MTTYRVKIGNNGRFALPAKFRKHMGLKTGDEVILIQEGDEARLVTARQALKRAKSIVQRYIPKGTRLAEELIRERHEEAARE